MPRDKNCGQGQPFWLDVATIHLIAVAVMPGHSLTGICYCQGKAVGCPLGNTQIREQCEVQSVQDDEATTMSKMSTRLQRWPPTPDVVDDDDCSAIPLQIPTLKLMTTTGTKSSCAAVVVACSLKAQRRSCQWRWWAWKLECKKTAYCKAVQEMSSPMWTLAPLTHRDSCNEEIHFSCM